MNESQPIHLPRGYDYFWYDEIDSTNREAFRKAASGQTQASWFCAKHQTDGRGAGANKWISMSGNLTASLLTRASCPPSKLPQISILAALSAIEAIEAVSGEQLHIGDLCLKWPNDILLNGCKICGILMESRVSGTSDHYDIVIGFGINLGHSPDIEGLFPAGNLQQNGWRCSRQQLFAALTRSTRDWLTIWREGDDFETLRLAWLQRSCHIGQSMTLKIGKNQLQGRFSSISDNGAMMLEDRQGCVQEIASGHIISLDSTPK